MVMVAKELASLLMMVKVAIDEGTCWHSGWPWWGSSAGGQEMDHGCRPDQQSNRLREGS